MPILAQAQTSPEKFLGFPVGADRQLADYSQIQAYFQKLAQESPRVKVVELGQTTLKKSLIMAVVTSEKNMARLQRYKDIAKQLRDARGLTSKDAAALVQEGKVIFAIGCNIHSTEIASSQMAMELAYKLAAGQTPFDAAKVLEDVIVLIIPSVNPDGEQMVTEWYRKYVGTPLEGGRIPWLWNYYAGHDDNRDFYMFNLPETRAVGNVLYHEWLPQIFIDEHQMGSNAGRFFVAPYGDPFLPDVHPLVWRSIELLGANMRYDLSGAGMKGVVTIEGYTGWWTGGEDECSWPHNIAAFLTEGASAKVATPIYIEPGELAAPLTKRRVDFPDPWPGGWWHLRDLVDYEMTFNFSAIKAAAQRKEDFLNNFYVMSKDEIEGKNTPDGLYAYVVSGDQHDYLTALKMVDVMLLNGLEVHQSETEFVADKKTYPAGSFVVLMSQPYRAQVQTLLGPQKYPDMRQYEGGPPIRPYDNAAWTLPMLMGVDTQPVVAPFTAKLKRITAVTYPTSTPPAGTPPYLALDSSLNNSYAVAFGLLGAKAQVSRAFQPVSVGTRTLPAGSFVVKNDAAVQSTLGGLLSKWHVPVLSIDSVQNMKLASLKNPRIGVYQSWQGNMDEGWLRYELDDYGIPFVTLHNADMRQAKSAGLASKIDVLVLASENPDVIVTGRPAPSASGRGSGQGALPPEYEGGIGREGVDAIRSFVDGGGILVTLNEACRLAFREFDAPARDAVQGLDSTKFFLPNSIVRIKVDPNTPTGFGMPAEAAVMFSGSIVMDTSQPVSGDLDRQVVASFPEENQLLSGWLIGGEHMARKAAVVDVKSGKGHIILIGVRAQFRGQSHGTYKFLLNSLLYAEPNQGMTAAGMQR